MVVQLKRYTSGWAWDTNAWPPKAAHSVLHSQVQRPATPAPALSRAAPTYIDNGHAEVPTSNITSYMTFGATGTKVEDA